MWGEQTFFGIKVLNINYCVTSLPLPLKAYHSAEVLEERMVEI